MLIYWMGSGGGKYCAYIPPPGEEIETEYLGEFSDSQWCDQWGTLPWSCLDEMLKDRGVPLDEVVYNRGPWANLSDAEATERWHHVHIPEKFQDDVEVWVWDTAPEATTLLLRRLGKLSKYPPLMLLMRGGQLDAATSGRSRKEE